MRLFDFLSPTVERVLHGSLEWLGFVLWIALLAVPIVTKRWRLLIYVLVASAVAAGVMTGVLRLIEREEPTVVNEIAARAGIAASTSSSVTGFAQFAAMFVVVGPFVSSRWRRAGVIALAVLVLIRFVVAYHLPGDVLVSIPIGAAVGAAVLLVGGRPDRRPTTTAIRLALVDAGLPSREVRPASVDAPRIDAVPRPPSTTGRACS